MRLNGNGGSSAIHRIEKQVVVQGEVALSLEQGLHWILIEEIPVYLEEIVLPRAGEWSMADEQVGAGEGTAGGVIGLAEHIVPDDGTGGRQRQAGNIGRQRVLIFDLDVVADRVVNEIVFDEAAQELIVSIRIPEIHPRPRVGDDAIANGDVPRRR